MHLESIDAGKIIHAHMLRENVRNRVGCGPAHFVWRHIGIGEPGFEERSEQEKDCRMIVKVQT